MQMLNLNSRIYDNLTLNYEMVVSTIKYNDYCYKIFVFTTIRDLYSYQKLWQSMLMMNINSRIYDYLPLNYEIVVSTTIHVNAASIFDDSRICNYREQS